MASAGLPARLRAAEELHRDVDFLARLWADAAGHPQLLSGLLARVVDGRSYDDAVDSLLDVALIRASPSSPDGK